MIRRLMIKQQTGFIVLCLLVLAAPVSGMEKAELLKGDSRLFSIEQTTQGWKASSSAMTVEVSKEKDGFRLKAGTEVFNAKIKDEKLTVIAPDGSVVFKIKDTTEKVKIYKGATETEAWSLVKKDSKQKCDVREGDRETGSIKFYPEKSLVRARDAQDAVVCTMKVNIFKKGPAVCLFSGIPEKQQLLLFTLLMVINY